MISADLYKYWQVDFESGMIRIIRSDGELLEEELEARYRAPNSQVASSIFDWEKWWVSSTTTKGDMIITEGFNPNSPPPFDGRPAVYLWHVPGERGQFVLESCCP